MTIYKLDEEKLLSCSDSSFNKRLLEIVKENKIISFHKSGNDIKYLITDKGKYIYNDDGIPVIRDSYDKSASALLYKNESQALIEETEEEKRIFFSSGGSGKVLFEGDTHFFVKNEEGHESAVRKDSNGIISKEEAEFKKYLEHFDKEEAIAILDILKHSINKNNKK